MTFTQPSMSGFMNLLNLPLGVIPISSEYTGKNLSALDLDPIGLQGLTRKHDN